jgi:hypothetical protein
MRYRSRICALVLMTAALLLPGALVGGCRGQKVDKISRVLALPEEFEDRDATVAGRVVRVFDPTQGLLDLAAYQVEDDSGKIWVISRNGAPSVGREVGLKGRVRKDFRLGSELLGSVLTEVERRTK